ncbi:MAG: tyrosine-protein kinase Etk/Wzc, partial [Algoriphagus sp.]
MNENNQKIQEGYPQQMLQPQQEKGADFDVKRLLVRILGAWPIILSSIVVALSLAFLINRYASRIYEVKAVVMVSSEQKGGMESLMLSAGSFNPRLDFENEVVVLGSRTMVRRTLEQLPFEVSYFGEGRIKSAEIYPNPGWRLEYDSVHVQTLGEWQVEVLSENEFRVLSPLNEEQSKSMHAHNDQDKDVRIEVDEMVLGLNEWWTTPHFRIRLVKAENSQYAKDRKGLIKVNLRSKESLVDSYFQKVKIKPTSEGSAAIDLSMQGSVPEKVQAYVDELIHQYQAFNLETKNKTNEAALAFISQELKALQDSLDQVEAILEQFRSENAAIDLSQKGEQLFAEVFSLENKITILKSQSKYFSYLEDYISKRSTVESVVVPVAMDMKSAGLQELVMLINQLQAERSSLRLGLTADNPRIKSIDNRIQSAREDLTENLSGTSQRVSFEIQELSNKRNQLEAEIRTLPKTEMELI